MKELVIDVSKGDDNVDFQGGISKHNLGGTIIKAGGNETRLSRYKDPKYEEHYEKAKAAGLHIGAYYYTVVTSVEEARKDAEHLIRLLEGHSFDLPIYMDVEDPRQFQLSKRALTDVIKTFCDTLRDAGYYAGLYIQGSAGLNNVVTNELTDYANGIAGGRRDGPTAAGDIGMWQQGTMRYRDGDVQYDDIPGYTDLDGCCVDYPSRITAGGTQYQNTETPKEKEKQQEVSTVPDNNSKLTDFCNGMYTACVIGSLGYDQYQRGNIYDGGECDCSSLVIGALQKAGFDTGDSSYTGNMSDELTARGGVRLYPNLADARPGDIILNDAYHVCAVISGYGGDATIAQASIDENGHITGGTAGDQSGRETNTKNIYTYSRGGDCILRYAGGSTEGSSGGYEDDFSVDDDLDVDGYAGPKTIKKGQAALGTTQDGVISGQFQSNGKYFRNVTSVTGERTGSDFVRAIQRIVGADDDGYGGLATSGAIQTYLFERGYDIEMDGYFGPNSVRALQDSLNKGLG